MNNIIQDLYSKQSVIGYSISDVSIYKMVFQMQLFLELRDMYLTNLH